jgi:hypothetical protein
MNINPASPRVADILGSRGAYLELMPDRLRWTVRQRDYPTGFKPEPYRVGFAPLKSEYRWSDFMDDVDQAIHARDWEWREKFTSCYPMEAS